MIELDIRSRLPIYEQLVEKLKSLIIANVLKADEQLPSVRHLAGQLTINPNTIQKAYRELENQGYIYSLPGKGSFVARLVTHENHETLIHIQATLRALISEALYLGVPRDSLVNLIDEIQNQHTKDNHSDENQEHGSPTIQKGSEEHA